MHYLEQAGVQPSQWPDFRSEMEELVDAVADRAMERMDERRNSGGTMGFEEGLQP